MNIKRATEREYVVGSWEPLSIANISRTIN